MPAEDQAEFRHPPPALPDGSMPTYGHHSLPRTADPESPLSASFGWGPDLGHLDGLDRTENRRASSESPLLIVALIVLGGVAVSVLIAALSVRV